MPEVKIVGRGVDTFVLNVCYADKQFQPIKQELDQDLQSELNLLQQEARENEVPLVTRWPLKDMHLFMQEKGSRGQWRWILRSPLLTVVISRGRLSRIIAQVRLSSDEYLWSCNSLAKAIVEVGMFLYGMFGDYLWFQVSEVDLCADVVWWDISQANWHECFILRAVGDDRRPRDEVLLVDDPDVKRWTLASIPLLCRAASITRQPRSSRNHLPISPWEFQMKFTGKRSERYRESIGGENGSPPIHQAIHFSEKLAPYTYYLVRVALRLMGVAASALDTGQFSLASSASFWKVSSSMPGTTASTSRSIGLMAKPPGT